MLKKENELKKILMNHGYTKIMKIFKISQNIQENWNWNVQLQFLYFYFCWKKIQGWFGQRAENQRPTFAPPKFQWSINWPYVIYIAECFQVSNYL